MQLYGLCNEGAWGCVGVHGGRNCMGCVMRVRGGAWGCMRVHGGRNCTGKIK